MPVMTAGPCWGCATLSPTENRETTGAGALGAGAFLATGFLAGAFLGAGFFLAGDFLAAAVLATGAFLAVVLPVVLAGALAVAAPVFLG